MKGLTLARKLQLHNNKRKKKSENREEVSSIFQSILDNTENIEKIYSKNFESKKFVEKSKRTIPKVGRLTEIYPSETGVKKRPKSSEFPYRPKFSEPDSARRKNQKKIFHDNDLCCCCCCRLPRPECFSLLNLDSRSLSDCDAGVFEEEQSEPWASFCLSSRSRRKCRSNPNFSKATSKKIFDGEREFHKVKRSLRLLGFKLSDFGVDSGLKENLPKRKTDEKSASFSTKITSRSISLDSLRAAVKRAWTDNRLDESHRRLMAQAAYEEWYFKKEQELWIKRNEERIMRLKERENLRDLCERKKEKSQEEFRKWLNNKRTKRRGKKNNLTPNQENHDKLLKTKEESEKAFLKWKKIKEEELEKKKKEKKKEVERRLNLEKERSKKRIMAENAFQLWAKVKENKISKEDKKQEQEMPEKRKRKKGPQISFEMWKAVKDEQIKEKIRHDRVACKTAREERLTQMEERMYEAEQAFEDWLEKVEARKQKQLAVMEGYSKMIPWIPA